jgi:uncharacterized membrane protein
MLGSERVIHAAAFVLLLVGLCTISAWVINYIFISNLVLEIAGITLGWGIILLMLYAIFKKLNWRWWS